MAAVVRLKRSLDEEPLEALVLACKRKKLGDDRATEKAEIPFTTILQFAGTVKDQEEDVVSHITNVIKKDKKKFGPRHTADITAKLRTELKEAAQENRFKVVNCFRDLKESEILESEKKPTQSDEDRKEPLTIVDVVSHKVDEKESSSQSTQSQVEVDTRDDESSPEKGYVYDLYYTNVAGSDGLVDLDNLLSVHPLRQADWTYYNPEDSSDMSQEDDDEEEEDSNDENNWRNDYPDSDHSINEEDMRMAMQMGDLNLSDGEELSSDDADDDFVYGVNVDPQDVALYGEGYANYKARMQRELYGKEDDYDNAEAYEHNNSSDEEEDPAERFM
ncbi:probable RNA polymerase II nuclear localization protein SLC7A6OS [Periplaneta americana]|uniref:probable RNA polymerase II nuclear localization protein SLC7A6OS n=1 Tax=Periplaneta americana TaxID=6978 RepID=UPI0037E84F70